MKKAMGVDIGTTSTKIATYHPNTNEVEEKKVFNHGGDAIKPTLEAIIEVARSGDIGWIGVTGDDSKEAFAAAIGAFFTTPPTASIHANRVLYPDIRTVLELGASFSYLLGIHNGSIEHAEFPLNCSAGSGLCLDHAAGRFGLSIDEFAELALQHDIPESISGGCAVFSGSEAISRMQLGGRRDNIAYGLIEATARHAVLTLGRGKIEHPFSVQGGVTENPAILKALEGLVGETHVPRYARTMPAIGAAVLAYQRKLGADYNLQLAQSKIQKLLDVKETYLPALKPVEENPNIIIREGILSKPTSNECYIGVDTGSVSVDVAVIEYPPGAGDLDWRLIAKKYVPTQSVPVDKVKEALLDIGSELDGIEVKGMSVTGSGREYIAKLLGGVPHVDEITAHRTGAQSIARKLNVPVDEIREIGGQDSKYIELTGGVMGHSEMNKVCAAGTGSFIEEQSKLLEVPIEDFARQAFSGKRGISFGSVKCSVYIQEQINARMARVPKEDLLQSIAYAIVHNYVNQFQIGDRSGRNIFFQGGVALNNAVVAAMQQTTNGTIIVPEHPEMMGAIGAAMLARREYE